MVFWELSNPTNILAKTGRTKIVLLVKQRPWVFPAKLVRVIKRYNRAWTFKPSARDNSNPVNPSVKLDIYCLHPRLEFQFTPMKKAAESQQCVSIPSASQLCVRHQPSFFVHSMVGRLEWPACSKKIRNPPATENEMSSYMQGPFCSGWFIQTAK